MVTKRIERAVVKAFGAAGASAFIKDLAPYDTNRTILTLEKFQQDLRKQDLEPIQSFQRHRDGGYTLVQGDDLFYNNNKRGERAFARLTFKDGMIRSLSPAECPQNKAQQVADGVENDPFNRAVTTFLKWNSIIRGDLRPGIMKIEESESDAAALDHNMIKEE